MARGSRPGRLLAVAGLALAALYGLVALGGQWAPRAGLETGGGSRLLLPATGSPRDLAEARDVVAGRLDDAGVPGARVRTSAEGLVVEVPQRTSRDVLDAAVRPAELTVRVVARSGRPAEAGEAGGSPSPSPSPAVPAELDGGELVVDPVAWAARPDVASGEAFEAASCPADPAAAADPERPAVACDALGTAYLLSAAVLDGAALDGVEAVRPAGRSTWGLALDLDGDGTRAFGQMTQRLEGTGRQFALVVDGEVVAAPQTAAVTDGRPQISADLTEGEAEALAASLRGGSLPAEVAGEPEVQRVGAALPAGPLGTGVLVGGVLTLLLALAAGLRLGVLGAVLPAALLVGAAVTHAGLLLLARGLDLALTPPAWTVLPLGPALAAGSAALLLASARAERAAGSSPSAALATATRRSARLALAADAVVAAAGLAVLVLDRGDALDGLGVLLLLAAAADLLVRSGVVAPLAAALAARPSARPSAAPRAPGASAPEAAADPAAGAGREPGEGPARTGPLLVVGAVALAALGLLVRPLDAGVDLTGGFVADLGRVGAAWDTGDTTWLAVAVGLLLLVVLGGLAGWTGRWQVVPPALAAAAAAAVVALGLAAWSGGPLGRGTVAALVVVLVVALAAAVVVLGAVAPTRSGAAKARLTRREAATRAAAPAAAWPSAVAAALAVPALAVLAVAAATDDTGEAGPAALTLAGGAVAGALAVVLVAVPALVGLDLRGAEVREADRRVLARRRHDGPDARPRTGARSAAGGAPARPPRAPAPARGPVARSAAAGRRQPTRRTRSQRGPGPGRGSGKK